METAAFISSVILLIISVILIIRQISIKKDLQNITAQLDDIIKGDTNALVTVSGSSKEIKDFAKSINDKLSEMRKKELALNIKNTEIGNAITNISHDIRTPLTSVRGYLDLLKDEDDKEKIGAYLTIIDERTEAMKQLTEELFQYSLLMTEDEIKTEKIILNHALEDAIAAGYTLLTSKNIIPEISITDKIIEINADKNLLSRIFGNIISNAAKYSEGDLFITLKDNGELEFRNTASGIDEIQAGKLFDRFYTVSNARVSTGLGLSIAKQFTEAMGGTISSSLKGNQLSIILKF